MRFHGVRVVVLAVAAAIVAAGCTSGDSGSDSAADAPLPGITATTAKVGFVVPYFGGAMALPLQIIYPPSKGQEVDIAAIAAWLNANGGLGGRQAVFVAEPFDVAYAAGTPRPIDVCRSIDSADVFATVINGFPVVRNCLPDDDMLTVVGSMREPLDQLALAERAPFLWAPGAPEYDSFVQAEMQLLASTDFLTGAREVHVLVDDTPVAKRAYANVVEPLLIAGTQLGVDFDTTVVDAQDRSRPIGAPEPVAEALGAMPSTVDRVIAVGGGRLLLLAARSDAALESDARWSVSSPGDPGYFTIQSQLFAAGVTTGSRGVGADVAADLLSLPDGIDRPSADPAEFPDPANPTQVLCASILDELRTEARSKQRVAIPDTPRAGLPTDSDYLESLRTCDSVMFLKAVLDKLPGMAEVSAEDFRDAAQSLGTTYRSAVAPATTFGEGTYAGTSAVRSLSYDAECQCFRYEGEPIPLG